MKKIFLSLLLLLSSYSMIFSMERRNFKFEKHGVQYELGFHDARDRSHLWSLNAHKRDIFQGELIGEIKGEYSFHISRINISPKYAKLGVVQRLVNVLPQLNYYSITADAYEGSEEFDIYKTLGFEIVQEKGLSILKKKFE